MRQQQRFGRQRRLAMASYDQDLQQSSSIIPEHVQGPSHSPFTASHRTFYPCNEKFSPLLVKKETGGGRTTRPRDAHLAQRKDPICRTDVLLSRASLVSGRSTQGNTSLVASGLDRKHSFDLCAAMNINVADTCFDRNMPTQVSFL